MKVLQHTRNERNRFFKPDRPDRFYRDCLLMVEVRRIEDPQQPMHVGVGLLPDWQRLKKGMLALDNYGDNLCIFRCLAVHQGARKDKSLKRTRELAESFFANHDIPGHKITRRHFPLIENYFKQGIAAYEVNEESRFALKYLPSRFDKLVSHK